MNNIERSLFAVVFAFAGMVWCQTSSAAGTNPCAEDIAKFCPDVKPGGGAIIECLEKHENDLTEACRAHEIKMQGARSERKEMVAEQIRFRQACGSDITRLCADATPGAGNIMNCLNSRSQDLSPSCSEAMKSRQKGKE